MKKIIVLALVSFFCLLPASQAADVPATSKITQVTVYQDRAMVTREAEVSLEEGPNSILFEGLSASVMEDSLRADGSSVAAVSIEGVEVKKNFTAQEVNPRVAAITEELDKLNFSLRGIQSKQTAIAEQKQFLDNVKNFSSAQISKDIMTKNSTSAEWAGTSQFMLDSFTDIGQKALDLEKTIQDKNKEIAAKQRELYSLQSTRQTEQKTVIVNVDAKSKTTFKVELTYIIAQAAWNISYDAKVAPDKNKCTLVSYGNVRQWTGEDWTDVKLSLSSAKPSIGGHMPELAPWYVDLFQNYPLRRDSFFQVQAALRSISSLEENDLDKKSDGPAAYAMKGKLAATPAALAEAAVSQELGSVNYDIAKPMTILSDNRSYKAPVKTENFRAVLDYEATPKLSPYAYIHSKVVNDKDYAIMAGTLRVFVNDNYIGQSSIGTVGRGESFDLYLGVDEEVKVKRTELTDKKKSAMMGLRARKDYAYKFELENYKTKNITLTIIDQLPVSKNNDIKTELISSSVKPTETKELGILKWTFDLAPKEKKELELQFFVEYPSDKNISGI